MTEDTELFREPHHVILKEPASGSMIRNIDRVKINDDMIIVGDGLSMAIIAYDLSGNVISSIGARGRGPGEYMDMGDFDLDDKGHVHVLDGRSNRILIYGPAPGFVFLKALLLPFDVDNIKCLPGGKYLLGLSSWNSGKESEYQVVVCDGDFVIEQVVKYYDRDTVDDNFWFTDQIYFIRWEDELFYSRPVDDHVYVFDSNGQYIRNYYYDFSNKTMPVKYRKNIESIFKKKVQDYCALTEFQLVTERYSYGCLMQNDERLFFMLDRENKVRYVRDYSKEDKIGRVITISDKWLITELNDYTNYPEFANVDTDSVFHVLCLYQLLI